MSQEHWAELKALFHAALELTGADREAFLARAGREHPHLERQLHALIASHDQASAFLEQPAMPSPSLAGSTQQLEPGTGTGAPDLKVGDVLDGTYEVEAMLGQGGMGVVYRVRHRALARTFAAKLIHARVASDPRFIERFTREAEALGRLKHPHIVDVTDFGVDREDGPRPYLVMEYLEGHTLEERLRAGPLPTDAALPVFGAIASALDYAHREGVLHLDLKPGNILLMKDGGDGLRPKILDFGLAQFVTAPAPSSAPATVAPIGTPSYMAPEVLDGEPPTAAVDIYALGVLMYEALAGRRPFEGSPREVLEQVRHSAPQSPARANPAIAAEAGDAMLAPLAKDPSARPATARAAVEALRSAMLAARQRQWRRTETPRRLLAAGAIAGLLALLFPVWQSSLVSGWENRSVDGRFALAREHAPSPGILLLLLDDTSLSADPTPLVQRADRVGSDLQRVFDAGARAVAIDLLLPAEWSRSPAFAQLVLHNADRLTLAAFSTERGEVVGPECITGAITVVLGEARANALFGFVNIDQDDDGVTRRGVVTFRDRRGMPRPSFAGRAASVAGAAVPTADPAAGGAWFWIDHAIDAARFERLSWADLETTLHRRPDLFRDRLVVVGADFAGAGDQVRLPTQGTVAGVVVQAMAADTILAGLPVRRSGQRSGFIASVIASGLLSGLLLLSRARFLALGVALALAATYAVVAVLALRQMNMVVPVAVPLLMGGTAAMLAWCIIWSRPPFPER